MNNQKAVGICADLVKVRKDILSTCNEYRILNSDLKNVINQLVKKLEVITIPQPKNGNTSIGGSIGGTCIGAATLVTPTSSLLQKNIQHENNTLHNSIQELVNLLDDIDLINNEQ